MNCRALLLAFVPLAAFIPTVHAAETAPASWKAGSASIVITPESPAWMAGYASRTKPSEGKVNELHAKALVIADAEGNRVAIVTTDLIGIRRELREAVVPRLEKELGLPPHAVLMNASHTHCGPELLTNEAVAYELDAGRVAQGKKYLAELEDKLVAVVKQAIERMDAARLEYSHARAGFAMNRRLPTPDGVQNSPYPDGPVDHDVPVLIVSDADGKAKTVLFGYACHNTTLGFQLLCSDYAGFAQDDFEERHPGVTAMFLMGCGADQNPYPRGKLELAQHHGRTLSLSVDVALDTKARRPVTGPLRTALEIVPLEFAPPPSRDDLTRLRDSRDYYERRRGEFLLRELETLGRINVELPFPVQLVRFGNDLTLVALAGETVVDYSLRLKKELKGKGDVWVAGYSNDVFGYIPSQRILKEGGYEGGGAMHYTVYPGPFVPEVENRIIEAVHRLVEQTAKP